MKIHKSLLVTIGLSGLMLVPLQARAADDSRPAVVTNLTGTLAISQNIPCNNTINVTTNVNGGQILLAPATGFDVTGGKEFALAGATLSFASFSASGSCDTVSQTQNYTAVGVQLVKGATFVATLSSPGIYSVSIPKAAVQFWEASTVNGSAANGYMQPSQDITGTINLNNGTATLHVVMSTSVHFQGGCVPPLGCIVDETDSGTLTTDLSGTIALPDTDGDGVPDITDNCPFVPNPDQTPVPTPTISAPPTVTLPSCLDHAIGWANAADVCFGRPITVTNNAPATFLNGANAVTWTVVDSESHAATATQTVTVVDTTPPVFTSVPADVTANTCGPVNLGLPTATDDCAGTVTFSNNAPGYFYVGSTPVTWTATDASGNHTTATQTVTVVDTTPPTVSCTSLQPVGNSFQIAATDACGAPVTRLGSFVLGNNEIVKIVETGQPGVRFIGTVGPNNIRFFQVGKGEAIVTATDPSNNVATAVCR